MYSSRASADTYVFNEVEDVVSSFLVTVSSLIASSRN
jgi:hypothetical protein